MGNNKRIWIILYLCGLTLVAIGQERPEKWDLRSCIEYARMQNIQIRKSNLDLKESKENVLEAKAQRLPSLSFSTGQNYVNRPAADNDKNVYSGNYDLTSSMSLYQGGRLRNNLKQMNLRSEMQELTLKEAENNIEIAVTQAFIQVLYAGEMVKINANTVDVSELQLERGKSLKEAGSLSKADLAQLEAEYTSDKYQLVAAQMTLENARLDLKQLLELGISDTMVLVEPEISDESILEILPTKESVYEISLEVMPQIKSNLLNIDVANIEKKKAWAGYLPTLNLSAGVGTNHTSGTAWGEQMKRNWSESVGLTLSIPVFSNRSVKTSVNLAALDAESAQLDYENVCKELMKSVETVYQDAVSAQNQFESARENVKALELSFELAQEQFSLGMKNILEMLTEKNNLLSARLEMLQAKYMAVLNKQLLNFYQGKEIEL